MDQENLKIVSKFIGFLIGSGGILYFFIEFFHLRYTRKKDKWNITYPILQKTLKKLEELNNFLEKLENLERKKIIDIGEKQRQDWDKIFSEFIVELRTVGELKFLPIINKVRELFRTSDIKIMAGDLIRFRTVSDNSRLMIWEARAAVYNRISELDPLQKFSFKKFIRKHAHRKKPKSKELKHRTHIVIQKKEKGNG